MKTAQPEHLASQPNPGDDPTHAIEQQEACQKLAGQIERLTDNQQEVIRLKFHGGLSYQEIADVTGLSKSNVGFLLHTAIGKLRQMAVT